jgi:preprotein translocase subunit SecD
VWVVLSAMVLAGCADSPAERSAQPDSPASSTASPTGSTGSIAIELRPVTSVVLPGQDEYDALTDRLGRDVFYGDRDGNGSFTLGVDLLYVLGDAFVGAGDYASAVVVPPPTDHRDLWQVTFELTADASDRLSAATAAAVGGEIAVVEGDRVLTVPTISEPTMSGEGVVPAASQEEAEQIVRIMLGP